MLYKLDHCCCKLYWNVIFTFIADLTKPEELTDVGQYLLNWSNANLDDCYRNTYGLTR
ncbi:MAG: hypothetical protein HZR80_11670 [Candidatus Heimdallarchaeota archaeon]